MSEAQRKYLYATKGAAWVKAHHFDNRGHLPSRKRRRGRRRIIDTLKGAK